MFLSADTVQGNMQGMNPYAYVGGNPETRNDPTGNMYAPPGGGGGGGNGGGGGTPPPSCDWWCQVQNDWHGITQSYQDAWNNTANDYKAAWNDEVHFAQQTQETIQRGASAGFSFAHIIIGVAIAVAVGGYLLWHTQSGPSSWTRPGWADLQANEGQSHDWYDAQGVGPINSTIHVDAEHIGKSQTYLSSRARQINKSTTSYSNAQVAQESVDYALSTMDAAEKSRLNSMIANPRTAGTLVLRRTVNQSVGYGYKYNRSTGTFTWFASTNSFQVTIRVDVNTGVPFIVTSYPTL